MDKRRLIKHKNKVYIDIGIAEKSIIHSKDTMKRLNGIGADEEYIKKKMEFLKTSVIEKEELIKKLNNNLNLLKTGDLNKEINKEWSESKQEQSKKDDERLKLIASNKEEKKCNKDKSKKYWDNMISSFRNVRQKKRDLNYGYKYFSRVTSELPDYMKKKLAQMPANKGYVWRGVYFYGDLPEQRGPCVMFERKRGDLLIIHETTSSEYKRYEKQGKDRRKLVHKEIRKNKLKTPSLMDFLKE
jgi:hypothetical protein